MPEPIAETYVQIDYKSVTQAQNAVDQFGRKFQQAGRDIDTQAERMRKAFTGIASAIGTIGVAKLGSDIINASVKMDQLNRMLVNIEGSQAAANKRFEQFRILAKEPVLDPFNLSKYYTALRSVNVESQLSIRFMKSLANAMAGVGAGNEQFAMSMEQVVQMMGKGKLVGQDLRVIAESFPQIRKYLGEAFGGIVDPEELAKKGYAAIDVLTRLNEVMEKAQHFPGGAKASIENFQQSLALFEAALGKNVLPTISKFLDKLTEIMDGFGKLPEIVQKALGWGTMGAIGGAGLLGLAGTLSFIVNQLGLATKGMAGMGALGAVTQTGGTGAAAGAGIAGGLLSKAAPVAAAIALTAVVLYLEDKSGLKNFFDKFISESPGGQRMNELLGYNWFTGQYVTPETKQGIRVALPGTTEWKPRIAGFTGPGISTQETPISYEQMIKAIGKGNFGAGMELMPWSIESLSKTRRTVPAYETLPITFTPPGMVTAPGGGYVTPGQAYEQSMARFISPEARGRTYAGALFGGGATGFDINKWQKTQENIWNAEAKYDDQRIKDLETTGVEMEKVKDEWDKLCQDMDTGIAKIDDNWVQSIDKWSGMIMGGYDIITKLMEKMGLATDQEAGGHLQGVLSGAAQGAAVGAPFGPWGIAIGAFLGGVAGYQEGGIAWTPQIAKVAEREPEIIIPVSKARSSRFGAVHVENMNIIMPAGIDRQQAENLIVRGYNDAVKHGRLG